MSKIPQKITKFLEKNKIKYEPVKHRTVYTAYDKAATLKVKASVIGKTLVLKTDPSTQLRTSKNLVVVLIPGNKNLDKVKLQKILNILRKKQGIKPVKKIDFISETVMKNKFKGVKLGALPPFGDLWKLPTFIDGGLLKEKNIFVNTGSYESSFKVSSKIFEKLGYIKGSFSKAKK
jgi:Ala-tRNA(Pro) deacylase